MKDNRKRSWVGYLAGIGAGVSYGVNPLFAKGLLEHGVAIHSMLFFRYVLAMLMMLILLTMRHESVRVRPRQIPMLLFMGVMFAMSSEGLFLAYKYIPAGLATTIVYLYPIFSAIILVCLGQRPSWQSWTAIAGTLAGVALICMPAGGVTLNALGIFFSATSALAYALYLVMVNTSKRISDVPSDIITMFSLLSGCVMFLILSHTDGDHSLMQGISGLDDWLNLAGLGLFPTMISMLCIAISTRRIGPAKTGILGVFEPLTAILVGLVVFGETLTTSVITGTTLAILSVLFLFLTKHRNG